MSISEAQLDTWSHQGSIQQSSETYATIRRVLESGNSGYAQKGFSIFLQGSYCNDTNIYSESDVDVVIRLNSAYQYDVSSLNPAAKSAFDSQFYAATYDHNNFKDDVIKVLRGSFGGDVEVGNKAIEIKSNGNRRKADVIAAIEYRNYYNGASYGSLGYTSGIAFYTQSGIMIANYPKQHSENCTSKHKATGGWFKPTVRIFKNMKKKLIADGSLAPGMAPSYFIEGLLYNVPSNLYGTSYQHTVASCLNYIIASDRSNFVCTNDIHYLIRDGYTNCWPSDNFGRYMVAMLQLWGT